MGGWNGRGAGVWEGRWTGTGPETGLKLEVDGFCSSFFEGLSRPSIVKLFFEGLDSDGA